MSVRGKVARKRLLICLVAVLMFFVADQAYQWFSRHYTIGATFPGLHTEGYCLPWRMYLVRKDPQHRFVRGELIAFNGDERMPKSFQRHPVAKMVLGVPGDRIEIRDDWVWVNGAPYDRMWLASDVHRDFVVKEGHYFVVGTHRNAVDSRYFGVISADAVIGPARPLF